MLTVGISVPAYRNSQRLRRCLTSIARCNASWLVHTVVVDDSGDGSVAAALQTEFPQVHWIVHHGNRGFAEAANHAVSSNECEYVLLLNDDCEIVRDPRPALQGLFASNDVFAVALRSADEHGRTREGAKRLVWKAGLAKVLHNPRDQRPLVEGLCESDYAVGGHAVFDRAKFIALSGFDALFHPFYWEDVDLSQRAHARGWRVLYAQNTEILHREDGAIRATHESAHIRSVTLRNRLLFSARHGSGVSRWLLPWTVRWLTLTAWLRRDTLRLQVLREFTVTNKSI
ncbi:MAG: glycosyltransferase [bacterium]|nr:glycosyltransferase [bacterium]